MSPADLEATLPGHPALARLGLERVRRWSARHSEIVEYRCRATPGAPGLLLKRISQAADHSRAVEAVSREFAALERARAMVGPALRETFPEPLLLLPEEAAMVVRKLPGVPLSQLLKQRANRVTGPWRGRGVVEAAGAVGRWLGDLHTATAQAPSPFDSERFLADVRRRLDRSADVGLDRRVREWLWEVAGKAGRAAHGTLEPTASRHGDFIPQNILIDGARLSVIDLENFAERDTIHADLAALTSWLRLIAGSPLYSRPTIEDVRERFLRSYGRDVSELLLQVHEFRLSLTVIAELNPGGSRIVRWQRLRWMSAAVSRLARQLDRLMPNPVVEPRAYHSLK